MMYGQMTVWYSDMDLGYWMGAAFYLAALVIVLAAAFN